MHLESSPYQSATAAAADDEEGSSSNDTMNRRFRIETELNAPIANIEIDEWLADLISENDVATTTTNKSKDENKDNNDDEGDDSTSLSPRRRQRHRQSSLSSSSSSSSKRKSNRSGTATRDELAGEGCCLDLCNSLEDLVKTFDKNVKECLKNYKNIDIGQLAPVQVRTEDDLINESQMWYTLTGNFGNLLPINYWSQGGLLRKYHRRSLDLKLDKAGTRKKKKKSKTVHQHMSALAAATKTTVTKTKMSYGGARTSKSSQQLCNKIAAVVAEKETAADEEGDTYFYDEEEDNFKTVTIEKCSSRPICPGSQNDDDDDDDDEEDDEDDYGEGQSSGCNSSCNSREDSEDEQDDDDEEEGKENEKHEKEENGDEDPHEFGVEQLEDDDDELKEQLDMHSMILSSSRRSGGYNRHNGIDDDDDEPIITAEQVLDEIDSIIKLENEEVAADEYEERTPDSGCYSVVSGVKTSTSSADLAGSTCSSASHNLSYLKYINTFAQQHHRNENETTADMMAMMMMPSSIGNANVMSSQESNNNDHTNSEFSALGFLRTSKEELNRLNVFELNEIIENIETTTKELSDILVQELALRDELEFEKETRNTFISLLMSIQEKRRQLSIENGKSRHLSQIQKKKNRKSLINLDMDINQPTHLTTVIPYYSGVSHSIQNLQILINLLKAINDDSHQVPELLTNYILKVVCPT